MQQHCLRGKTILNEIESDWNSLHQLQACRLLQNIEHVSQTRSSDNESTIYVSCEVEFVINTSVLRAYTCYGVAQT